MANVITKRFEFKDNKSSKFWEISVAGNGFIVRYGKIGTAGQTQSKEFADAVTAEKQAQKLMAVKTSKGYIEVAAAGTPTTIPDITEVASPEEKISLRAKLGDTAVSKKTTKVHKRRSPSDLANDPTTEPSRLESLFEKTKSINRLLVKHPNASAALLEKLSHSFDPTIRQQVALNANTPNDVLLRLAWEFPKDIIRNPVFDQLFLEESDQLLTRIGGWLKTILEHHDCPPSLMNWAVKHGSRYERSVVARNPVTPVELLNYLAANDGEIGLRGPLGFEQAKAILLAEIKRRIKSDSSINSYRYRYKQFPWDSSEHPFGVRQAVMFRENDARSLVLEILNVDFERIISRCNAQQLEKIIDDKNWNTDKLVIPALINHPDLKKEMLKKILDKRIGRPGEEEDMHEECTRAILGHPFCPVEYIEWYNDDRFWGTIASNSSVKLEWLEKRVDKYSCWMHVVRGGENLALGAANNLNCSAKLLRSVINWRWGEDCDPCDLSGQVRLAIIKHPNCSDKLKKLLIDEFYNSGESYLILKLLTLHNLPDFMQEKAVKKIQNCDNVNILLHFASMPCCPEELRHKLLLIHASDHKHCEVISNILTNYPDDNLWQEAINILLASGDINSKIAVAASYIRRIDVFDQILLDSSDQIRRVLAANPSCPPEFIEILVNDTNPIIQLTAACNANAPYSLWLEHAYPYLVESVGNWPVVRWSIENELSSADDLDPFERDLYLPDKYASAIMKDGPSPLSFLALLGNGVTKQELSSFGKWKGEEEGWMYRSVVALNKTTDMEILKSLAKDEDLIVRTLAATSLESAMLNDKKRLSQQH